MKFARIFRKIGFIYVLTSLLAASGFSSAGNSAFGAAPLVLQQDTVEIDTTGTLPFPFNDQPAFGQPSQDTSKIFLNKPGNINFEIEYDPETGEYIFYEKIGNLNYRLPQSMSLDEYIDYDFVKSIKNYWKPRSRQHELDEQAGLFMAVYFTVGI
jgi:hypothetical protein